AGEHALDHLRILACLDVRPEFGGIVDKGFSEIDVLLYPIAVNQKGGGIYRIDIFYCVPGHAGRCNSKTASISTGMLLGSDPMPTALRTPTPLASPHTLANNS